MNDEERFEALFRTTFARVLAYGRRRAPTPFAHDIAAETYAIYRGPTAEQQRLAAFRDDLESDLPEHGCVSYRDLRRTVEATLAEHQLQGWRIEPYRNTDVPRAEGGCANVSFIDEPKRTVVLIAGLPETSNERPG